MGLYSQARTKPALLFLLRPPIENYRMETTHVRLMRRCEERIHSEDYLTSWGMVLRERVIGVPWGTGEGGKCPIDHSAMAKAFTQMSIEEKKKEGYIHKLYEQEGN